MTNAERLSDVEMKQALLDPRSVFATPETLLLHGGLSTQQKIEILRRWEYDASEISVAVEEGMPDSNGDLLHRILHALDELSGGIGIEQTGPTKQHGILRSATKPKIAK
jgi:hypothetical protein